jgi:hypothetical protein
MFDVKVGWCLLIFSFVLAACAFVIASGARVLALGVSLFAVVSWAGAFWYGVRGTFAAAGASRTPRYASLLLALVAAVIGALYSVIAFALLAISTVR